MWFLAWLLLLRAGRVGTPSSPLKLQGSSVPGAHSGASVAFIWHNVTFTYSQLSLFLFFTCLKRSDEAKDSANMSTNTIGKDNQW